MHWLGSTAPIDSRFQSIRNSDRRQDKPTGQFETKIPLEKENSSPQSCQGKSS
ncbi:MAG: hypothetical protein HC925_02175 [Coleofasciculaceae cyanobacterium SM2_3_26]|nr:hypothetical protein [Coleofasciculaceae cyanobacterium SM2_3_26]